MNQFDKTIIGKPEPWLIEAAAAIGLDFAGLTHETTDHFRNHVINRHGDPAKHGTATVTNLDFDRIPAIVKSPDMAIIGAVRWGNLCNVYIKIEAGITYLYFDEVLDSKRNKALRSSTFYKVTRPLILDEVLKNVARNDKTDISNAKILTMP
ncbi:hypothetical protein AGMMS49940_18220 [Spirochaetia bacterium]|nr:hypothetical protein AGMMS49940_18220 [Spirochaetia bacterium]